MAEEETQGTEASQDGPVSFEDLDRAAEGLSEDTGADTPDSDDNATDGDVGTTEDEPEGEGGDEGGTEDGDSPEGDESEGDDGVLKPEPDDNAERSKLGRKVKTLEDTLQTLIEKLDQTIQAPKPDSEGDDDDDEFDIPTTQEEFERKVEEYESKKTAKIKQYESGYVQKVNELWADEDEDVRKEIEAELLKNFNGKYSDDPARDAEINYLKAERSYLRKLTSTLADKPRINPLKGEKTPTPVGGESIPKKAKDSTVKLDAFAQEFADSVEMSEESRREALGK